MGEDVEEETAILDEDNINESENELSDVESDEEVYNDTNNVGDLESQALKLLNS